MSYCVLNRKVDSSPLDHQGSLRWNLCLSLSSPGPFWLWISSLRITIPAIGDAVVKNPPTSARGRRDVSLIPGSGRSPGEGHGTHSSVLAWRIPIDRGAWRAMALGLQRVRHNRSNLAHTHLLVSSSLFSQYLIVSKLPPLTKTLVL